MEIIETRKAAMPGGHYSQAVVSGGLIFVSGILPIEPDCKPDASLCFMDQANCVLRNAEAILHEAGVDFSKVVKTTVYITDIGNWPAFDQAYAGAFGAHKPARAIVPVLDLHHDFKIEIELIASAQQKSER